MSSYFLMQLNSDARLCRASLFLGGVIIFNESAIAKSFGIHHHLSRLKN
jgi:hypothetical protein